MKHLKLFFMMLVIANTAFITSCSKDDESDDTEVSENPVINLAGDNDNVAADITVIPGATFQVTVNAAENPTTKKNLKTFQFSREFTGLQANLVLDSAIGSEKTFTIVLSITAANIEGTEKMSFTIIDKDGKSGTASFVVTTENPVTTTPLGNEITNGVINNLIGPSNSVWDLVADASKPGSTPDAEKDMQNTTEVGSTAPEVFEREWDAKNDTRFVKVSGFDYDNATVESATAAYAGGTPESTVSNVAVGDQYVAKLRGGDDYAVIEITAVDVTTSDNTDKIEFKYRKK